MAMLRERLRPTVSAGAPRSGGQDPLWLRYADLVKLGYSTETSLIVSEAPVPLHTVTRLLIPDGSDC